MARIYTVGLPKCDAQTAFLTWAEAVALLNGWVYQFCIPLGLMRAFVRAKATGSSDGGMSKGLYDKNFTDQFAP